MANTKTPQTLNKPMARRRWLKRLPLCASTLCLSTRFSQAAQTHFFDPVQLGRPFIFPRDHGAHLNFRTEWWYVTGFLAPSQGQGESLGFQVTFFRSATGEASTNPSRFAATQLLFSHAALALKSEGKLIHDQAAMRAGFDRLTTLSEQDTDVRSMVRSRARFIKREEKSPGASTYTISVHAPMFSLDLNMTAPTPPALQGVMGFSQKGPSIKQASHYYSRPQLQVQGRVIVNKLNAQNYRGRAWMDHEWSNEVLDESAAGWDWLGLNFDNGHSLMAFQIRPKLTGEPIWSEARGFNSQGDVDFVLPAQDQAPARREALKFKPKRFWRSLRSNALYPVELDIELQRPNSSVKRILSLQPLMDDQEVDARASTGGFYWEGLVFVFENQKRIGQGYLELTGYAAPMKL